MELSDVEFLYCGVHGSQGEQLVQKAYAECHVSELTVCTCH